MTTDLEILLLDSGNEAVAPKRSARLCSRLLASFTSAQEGTIESVHHLGQQYGPCTPSGTMRWRVLPYVHACVHACVNCLTPEDKIHVISHTCEVGEVGSRVAELLDHRRFSLGCSEEALWCYTLAVLICSLNNSERGRVGRGREKSRLVSTEFS